MYNKFLMYVKRQAHCTFKKKLSAVSDEQKNLSVDPDVQKKLAADPDEQKNLLGDPDEQSNLSVDSDDPNISGRRHWCTKQILQETLIYKKKHAGDPDEQPHPVVEWYSLWFINV